MTRPGPADAAERSGSVGARKITNRAVLDWMQTLSVVVVKKVRP